MSHIVTVHTQVRDLIALRAACGRLGLEAPAVGATVLFSGRAQGHLVQLSGWRYPLVFDLAAGQVQFDNYNGAWGEQSQLNKLLQIYAVEKAKREARRQGYNVCEQLLLDGAIKLVIQDTSTVGGAA